MARLRRDAEEVRERREPDPPRPLAEQPSGEPDRVDDGRGDLPPGEPGDLDVEEGEIEPRVVRDERCVPGERDELPHRELGPRRPSQRARLDPRERGDGRWERDAGIDERLERVLELQRSYPLGADLADPRRAGRQPRRLEVDDDEVGVLEEDVGAGRRGEPDRGAAPRETRVPRDDVVEERPGERRRRAREGEERPRRLLGGNGPAAGLDELHQTIGGVEAELHGTSRYTNIRSSYLEVLAWLDRNVGPPPRPYARS